MKKTLPECFQQCMLFFLLLCEPLTIRIALFRKIKVGSYGHQFFGLKFTFSKEVGSLPFHLISSYVDVDFAVARAYLPQPGGGPSESFLSKKK